MRMLNNGSTQIAVKEQGAGAPLVMLHGIQGTARAWDTTRPALAQRFRVITPDLRGRGQSSIPHGGDAYSLDAFASDLRVVLRAAAQPPILVAWSMGVSVTLEMLRGPAVPPLRGMILVSGTACAGHEARWFAGTSASAIEEEARARAKALGLSAAAEPHAVAASWLHTQRADFRPLLPRIATPTLVIHGTDDDQCPIAHGRQIASSIPGARIDEWKGAGHNPMAHDPARFVDAVQRFADSLPGLS